MVFLTFINRANGYFIFNTLYVTDITTLLDSLTEIMENLTHSAQIMKIQSLM